ncbi:DUF4116 domain-containing protein, partial [Candidatus Uhrbacteria bacterium]|nr:DUF4116 domain-containing protein [Candidatus Uhrbacteria bacterium]
EKETLDAPSQEAKKKFNDAQKIAEITNIILHGEKREGKDILHGEARQMNESIDRIRHYKVKSISDLLPTQVEDPFLVAEFIVAWKTRVDRSFADTEGYGVLGNIDESLPDKLKDNAWFIMNVAERTDWPGIFASASDRIKGDRAFVEKFIEKFPGAITQASEELRRDPKLVMKALIGARPDLVSFIMGKLPSELKNDRAFMLEAVQRSSADMDAYSELPDQYKDDLDFVLPLIERSPWNADKLSSRMKGLLVDTMRDSGDYATGFKLLEALGIER